MKDIWSKLPKYKGWNPNKKALLSFKQMAAGLLTYQTKDAVRVEIEDMVSRFGRMAKVINRRIDAYSNICTIWVDLNELRSSLKIGDVQDQVNDIEKVKQDMVSLLELMKNHIVINPDEKEMRPSLRAFIEKTAYVRKIYGSMQESLREMQYKLAQLKKKPQTPTNAMQIKYSERAINSLTKCAQICMQNVDLLELLEIYCRHSKSLCDSVSEGIDIEALSNFIDRPEQSEETVVKLNARLMLIYENINGMTLVHDVEFDMQGEAFEDATTEETTIEDEEFCATVINKSSADVRLNDSLPTEQPRQTGRNATTQK